MAWIALAVSTAALYWIYDGYARFLSCCVLVRRSLARLSLARLSTRQESPPADQAPADWWPEMTVLLTVHNEAAVVEARVRNLLSCDYPADKLHVLVASDGSTDATAEIVRSISDARITVMETPGLGKTGTQNGSLKRINSDVVVFTDADIVFDADYLKATAARFRDPRVGAVDGRLLYTTPAADSTIATQGFYWKYELRVRPPRIAAGLAGRGGGRQFFCTPRAAAAHGSFHRRRLHRASGRCAAGRAGGARTAVQSLQRIRGRRRAYAATSYSSDTPQLAGHMVPPGTVESSAAPVVRAGTVVSQAAAMASPVFLLVALFSSCWVLITSPGLISAAAAGPYLGLFAMAGLGWLATVSGRRIPFTGIAFSFLLANTAFLVGIVRATLGRRIHAYRNV